ncbi:cell division cycle protein 20 homolog [Lepeophtheirus salmonis]|uniref:Cell division cycle protein 20 homolog [Aplysia californica] n=1 Tax=Lepeophtheirus salmonis TaxID=72036 RepID=A0A0K2TAZ6_LEPSM|nr:cell division cycle protein 20 homolog [Lepeophtheirus salmonis]
MKNTLQLESTLSMSPTRGRSKSIEGYGNTPKSLTVPPQMDERRHSDSSNDRFIPNRSTTDYEFATHAISRRGLSSTFLVDNEPADAEGQKILSFNSSAPKPQDYYVNSLKVLYSTSASTTKHNIESKVRHIPNTPVKVLDAPNLSNDFYIRVMDWSSDNILSVIFSSRVLLWNANDTSVDNLTEHPEGSEYTCVAWENKYLAIADYSGHITLWDASVKKCLRRLSGHFNRVGTLGWSEHNLASGSRSGEVLIHDVRIKNHIICTLNEHTQEVCGIDWNSGGTLLATGGNDNTVFIWDIRSLDKPTKVLTQHQSAVKGIKWCPWSNITLATGGGTSDRCLKIWNASNGNCVKSIDTGSQISSVLWNSDYKEIITGHGFSSNQLSIWKYSSLGKIKDLEGHSSRIICLAMNPDCSIVASAAGDESIRIWEVWPPKEKSKKVSKSLTTKTTLFQKIR